MTSFPRIEDVYPEEVCFKVGDTWYLIPYIVLSIQAYEWETCGADSFKFAGKKLRYWLDTKLVDRDIDFLKTILAHRISALEAFILYDSFLNETEAQNGIINSKHQKDEF